MRDFHYANKDGVPAGPVSLATLELWLRENRLTSETWVLEVGTENWIPLSTAVAFIKPLPPPPPVPAAANPAIPSGTDQTIMQDHHVLVTTTRVILNGTTYALRNITSVRMGYTAPNNGCAIVLLLFGALLVLGGIAAVVQDQSVFALLSGVVAVAVAIFWMRGNKTQYHIVMNSSSGEAQALTSTNRAYIERIIGSINEAIIRYK